MYPYPTRSGESGYGEEGVSPRNKNLYKKSYSNSLDELIEYLKKEVDIHADSLLLKVSNHYDELTDKLNREKQKIKEKIQQWKKEKKDEFDQTNNMEKTSPKIFYGIMDKTNLSKIFSERLTISFETINIPKETCKIEESSKIDKHVDNVLDELVNNFNEKQPKIKNVPIEKLGSRMSDDDFYGDSLDDFKIDVSMAPDIPKPKQQKHDPPKPKRDRRLESVGSVDFMDERYKPDKPNPKWNQWEHQLWEKRQQYERELKEKQRIKDDEKERFHVNKLEKKAIRKRVTELSINDWQLTDDEWNQAFKNGRGVFDLFRDKPSRYGQKLGKLIKHNGTTLDLSGEAWLHLTTREKRIVRECLTFQRVIFNSPRKFPKLGKLLKSIDTLILNKIGSNFGLAGCEWVSPILTSKYSAIRTVHIENGCDLDNKCLEYLNDEFKEGFKHIEHHKHLHLKCLRIETNMGSEKTDAKSTFLDVMLQYSNIDKICLDRSPYELKGERSMETPGGDNINEKNPPRWEFVLYVLRDF